MNEVQVAVFVGVDVAKADHYAQVITADGAELFARAVANDEGAIEALLAEAAASGPAAVVVDMTASGAQLLLATAARCGVPVAYVTGLAMRRAAQLYAGAAKTDARDAWVLADYARRNADRLTWLDIGDDLLLRLRLLNGLDTDLAGDAQRIICRCRDALLAVSPALERAVGERLDRGGVRDALTRWPTPTALRRAGRSRVTNTIARHSPKLAPKVAEAVFAALDAQTVTLPAEATWGEIIADLLGDLEHLHRRRDELVAQIQEAFLAYPLGEILVSLCGFGPRTGARALAEIGDPHRFANGSRLAAYAGLAPVDRRSGRSRNTTSRHRGGNHRLKDALFTAAWIATRHDPAARAYYQRKRAEGNRHSAAVICVARRRCDLILAMLKTRTPYDANHTPTSDPAAEITTPLPRAA